MAEIVKGSNMALSIYNNDTEVYVVVACSRSVTLNLELSAREVTNYNSAFFKEYKPDVIGWDLSDDG